jgi:hypothetical protein
MPPLYNAYEAKLLNVLHSKLVKKKKSLPCLLSDPLIQGLQFLKENGLVIMGDLPPFFLKKISLFSRATCHTHSNMVYFQGRPIHILTLVYFHGRPALLSGLT